MPSICCRETNKHYRAMTTFKYRTDRKTIYVSIALMMLMIVLGIALMVLFRGGFFSTWYLTLIVALVALAALSIPRNIVILPATIEVRCLCNLIEIERAEIVSVRRVSRKDLHVVPLLGIWGLFGYYGTFLDYRNMSSVQIYATQWNDFVEIVDSSDNCYYLSSERADELIASIGLQSDGREGQ